MAPAKSKTPKVVQIQGDDRILHALDRFTFGPRPGDIAAVKAFGLKRWFDQQLAPSSIDDSALNARLASFPAMKLSQEALMQRYPSPPTLRAIENQNLPLPTDPLEHVIYADQLAFYKAAQEKKAAKKNAAGQPDAASAAPPPADMMDPASPTSAAHEEQLYSAAEAAKIIDLPPDQRVRRILALSPENLIRFRQSLTKREFAGLSQGLEPEQKEILMALSGSTRLVHAELLQSRLTRDIYSDRQLEAVMTDFWLNHFNIDARKNQNEPYLLSSFERDVIRPNALGHFEDLLVATAKSPAMLVYLDNWQSIGPDSVAAQRAAGRQQNNPAGKAPKGINENYARELMELHTLGVGGGYTQADVTQVARVFTGWTVERPNLGSSYKFEPNRHEPGAKQILGVAIQAAGEDEGLQVLHLLATSPSTAKFICTKLAVRFVSDDPPPALVNRMAKTFLSSNGDIKAVLKTMFNSPEFWSTKVYRAKVKTPLEFVVSAVRAGDVEITNAQPLVQALDKLGMPLYGMQTPNGYSWKSEPWVSTGALVNRMNFALTLTTDRIPGVRMGLPQLFDGPAGNIHPVAIATLDPTEKENKLELLLLGRPASDRTRATVLQQAATNADGKQPSATSQTATVAGLLLGSPDFQRR